MSTQEVIVKHMLKKVKSNREELITCWDQLKENDEENTKTLNFLEETIKECDERIRQLEELL